MIKQFLLHFRCCRHRHFFLSTILSLPSPPDCMLNHIHSKRFNYLIKVKLTVPNNSPFSLGVFVFCEKIGMNATNGPSIWFKSIDSGHWTVNIHLSYRDIRSKCRQKLHSFRPVFLWRRNLKGSARSMYHRIVILSFFLRFCVLLWIKL